MSNSKRNELFWSGFCSMLPVWSVLFAVNIVAAFMLAFSFLFLDPGSVSFTIAVLDIGVLFLSFAGLIVAIRKCGRRQQNEYER